MPAALCLLLVLLAAAPAGAYVGPGAGFAFVSTAYVFFVAVVLAVATLLTWPVRALLRLLRRGRRVGAPGVRRVVVLGFDGQDPAVTERLMAEGRLPNFSRLAAQGCFARLATTLPASSPVAWSTFMTGCNPGKHRVFDFLVPNRRSLLPELAGARVSPPARFLRLGRYRIPLSGPRLAGLRRGTTFWRLLGEHGVFSTVIRVPMTFPPERFAGLLLAASPVPDLKGTQGTYVLFSSDPAAESGVAGGLVLPLTVSGAVAHGAVPGPANTLVEGAGEMAFPFRVLLEGAVTGGAPELEFAGQRHALRVGEYTPWVRAAFRPAPGVGVTGICRFLLLGTAPRLRLYATPLQIDPESPALPIAHPASYAVYLAKNQGPFATLGVAEDLTALNEGAIGERDFLEQCRLVHREREAMFFDALERTRDGAVVCVFDLLDRVQHMCFGPGGGAAGDPVGDAYAAMDELLGCVLARADGGTVLMVLSDHGFRTFRRAVDLNAWLREQGLLAVKEGAEGADLLQAVDWGATQAYAVGFGGIYLNLRGREARGIVEPGAAAALKAAIREKLAALCDPADGQPAIREVFDRDEAYRGPYVEDAPDLTAGFRAGYRASWTCVTGGVGASVFQDNLRPWKGDHNVHPDEVPGVFFCNRPVAREDLRIEDVAPTVLRLFGVPVPGHVDGRPFDLAAGARGAQQEGRA
jgi:predicted AlkP superfamily phosphohydrolase/phosphomutase